MTRQLCISVTLLDPLFHGKGDGDEPEWPPSPMRLFQALLAGSRTGSLNCDWSNSKAEAFRWLERCESPQILSPEARPAAGYTLFVPNNDSDKKFDRQDRLTSKIARPNRLLCHDKAGELNPTLHYLWSIPEDNWPTARSHAELLCREARHLLALGWGIDQVVGNGRILNDAEAAALPGRRWRAWTAHRPGLRTWRIPAKDSLEDLERVHESFVKRVVGKQYHPPLKPRRFQIVSYMSAAALPPRSYAAFEFPERVAFRQEDANKVAAMLRSLACRDKHRNDFNQQFPEDTDVYLAGHAGQREKTPARFSYLPLPTIGHERADGMIRRVLIAEPYGADGARARWAQQRLRHETLKDTDGNERGILLDLWRPTSADMTERYVAQSRIWSTVTPVVLPGFDHGKQAKAERLLLRAARQAGLPIEAIAELTLRKAPFWPGSQHPARYFVPNYLTYHPKWHVRIQFRDPVAGPLSLGGGRHCGLGVFACEDKEAATM
jgi:CRISPR-associated protein Csb2